VITSPVFAGKNYAVLGLARSGLATVATLAASGATITAWDSRADARQKVSDRARIADPAEIDLAGFDGVVVSPGVPLNRHPIVGRAAAAGVPIMGDIELFAQARASLPPHKVVGITGTNGKSTTTALTTHIIRNAGRPVRMGGNIGLPVLGQNALGAGGVYVLELSSYQIDLTHSLDCDVAALLNLSPDHLDRYSGFAAYIASKERLFAMQSPGHARIVAVDGPETTRLADRLAGVRRVRAAETGDQSAWPALQGPHNAQNIATALAIADALGIARASSEAALASFVGLPHRMELVGEAGGVLFVNDSKATNTASAAPALAAWPPAPHPRIHWIVGGLAKEEGLGECGDWIGHVACAYTIGEAGAMFADALAGRVAVEQCEMMGTAVERAIRKAKSGDVVLLAPACASFDQFKDYEARGDSFRALAQSLAGAKAAIGRRS